MTCADVPRLPYLTQRVKYDPIANSWPRKAEEVRICQPIPTFFFLGHIPCKLGSSEQRIHGILQAFCVRYPSSPRQTIFHLTQRHLTHPISRVTINTKLPRCTGREKAFIVSDSHRFLTSPVFLYAQVPPPVVNFGSGRFHSVYVSLRRL